MAPLSLVSTSPLADRNATAKLDQHAVVPVKATAYKLEPMLGGDATPRVRGGCHRLNPLFRMSRLSLPDFFVLKSLGHLIK